MSTTPEILPDQALWRQGVADNCGQRDKVPSRAGERVRARILAILRAHGGNVTWPQIAAELGCSKQNVHYHLLRLVGEGRVRRVEPDGLVRWQRYTYVVVAP